MNVPNPDKPYTPTHTQISPGRYLNTYTGVEFRDCPKWDAANERWHDPKNPCAGSVAMLDPKTMAFFRICSSCR